MRLLDNIFGGKNTVKVSVTAKEPYIGTPQPAIPAPVLIYHRNIGELNKQFNLSKLKLFEDSEYLYKLNTISK